MMKLLKKYGLELKYKKCDLFRFLEGQKEVFVEDGFIFKMTNEEEMFKYEVVLNSIFNKNKIAKFIGYFTKSYFSIFLNFRFFSIKANTAS